jgi:hypothetical protein
MTYGLKVTGQVGALRPLGWLADPLRVPEAMQGHLGAMSTQNTTAVTVPFTTDPEIAFRFDSAELATNVARLLPPVYGLIAASLPIADQIPDAQIPDAFAQAFHGTLAPWDDAEVSVAGVEVDCALADFGHEWAVVPAVTDGQIINSFYCHYCAAMLGMDDFLAWGRMARAYVRAIDE